MASVKQSHRSFRESQVILTVFMTNYGLPYFLEDKTGSLSGSEFVDIHDRMRLCIRCTARDAQRCAFMIYNINACPGGPLTPGAVLDFGPSNTLGTVSIGSGSYIPMSRYLTKVSPLGRYCEEICCVRWSSLSMELARGRQLSEKVHLAVPEWRELYRGLL